MGIAQEALLQVRNLSKRYGAGCPGCDGAGPPRPHCPSCGSLWGCYNVSFDLYPGEIIGIVGESGSGKSTLLRCLYFDEEATSGSVTLGSHHPQDNILASSRQQKRWLRNQFMGMVYQNPQLGLRMNYSSSANIAEKLIAAGVMNMALMQARARELLTRMEISLSRIDESPKVFSGGMQQRVQIARALANRPPLLLLDEITTGLDLTVQARVLDLVREIQREFHVAMILVSHDLGVIRLLADRTLVMQQGTVIESGLTDQIMQDPQQTFTQLLVHSLL